MIVRCPVARRLLAIAPVLQLVRFPAWAQVLMRASADLRGATSR